MHWKVNNGKGQLQTSSPHMALKTAKPPNAYNEIWQSLKEHRLGPHPKQRKLAIRYHQISGLKKPELDEKQIEERDQN
jgi:hypothetical protein